MEHLRLTQVVDLATQGYANEPTLEYTYSGDWNSLFIDNRVGSFYEMWQPGHEPVQVFEKDVRPDNVELYNFKHLWVFDVYKVKRLLGAPTVVYAFGLYYTDEMFKSEKLGGAFVHDAGEGVVLRNGWSSRSDVWNSCFGTKLIEATICSTNKQRWSAYVLLEDAQEDIKRFSKYGFVDGKVKRTEL